MGNQKLQVQMGDIIRITKNHPWRPFHNKTFRVLYSFMRKGQTYASFAGGGAYGKSFKRVNKP